MHEEKGKCSSNEDRCTVGEECWSRKYVLEAALCRVRGTARVRLRSQTNKNGGAAKVSDREVVLPKLKRIWWGPLEQDRRLEGLINTIAIYNLYFYIIRCNTSHNTNHIERVQKQ